jgi:16S rRNA A1518/A1519 N6-dimethyltransferase RsmA/KsgA/DIM1 with predicted DNA glycosylase/AP lyase activity
LQRSDFRPVPKVGSVLLAIKRRPRPLLQKQDVTLFRDFVEYGFRRWKPNLKLAYKHAFTYTQWKRMGRELHFPINATPTELAFEQWVELYRRFNEWHSHREP